VCVCEISTIIIYNVGDNLLCWQIDWTDWVPLQILSIAMQNNQEKNIWLYHHYKHSMQNRPYFHMGIFTTYDKYEEYQYFPV